MEKIDLEKIFNIANVKIGEEFYSSDYGWVIYDGICRYMGTTLLDFKCKMDISQKVSYRCDGTLYYIEGRYTQITIHPDSVKTGWLNWLDKRVKNNTTTEKDNKPMFQTENKIIYLVLTPKNFMTDLTIREWNEFVDSYSADSNAVVEPYDENMDGYVFITTTLENILNNHSVNDLRFLCTKKSQHHKTEIKLNSSVKHI